MRDQVNNRQTDQKRTDSWAHISLYLGELDLQRP